MLDARQQQILLAVIREHVRTAEPVGSQGLLQRYDLGCSAATIRNEMARLEEAGYLAHPHTSAGRLPSHEAYRFYVDRILKQGVTPPPDGSCIADELAQSDDVGDLVERTSRLLAQLTRHTALVLAPRLKRTVLKYLQLVPAAERRVRIVVLTGTGQVLNRVVELDRELPAEDLEHHTKQLNDRLRGRCLDTLDATNWPGAARQIVAQVQAAMDHDSHVARDGTSNLCAAPEFRESDRLRRVLELLEQESAVAELMEKSLADAAPVQVSIPLGELGDCALVTAVISYDGQPAGSIGILGPARLPYERLISVVGFAADCFTSRLAILQA
ncbi:MAG: heat-inducible transcriptional repressor HrcA [Candidatus Xenobia bacterium]